MPGAALVFAVLAPGRGAGTAAGSVMLAISKPPENPALPKRLSEAKSREPTLPGRKRFWSSCIQTKRSVSGELLVYRICSVPLNRFVAVSRVALSE